MIEQHERDLFSAVKLGALALANRIVMAPLTRSRMDDDGVALAVAPREAYYGGGAHGYTDWLASPY